MNATWDAAESTLTVRVTHNLPGEVAALVEVREAEQLTLPLIGLKANAPDLLLSCEAQAGSVPTPVRVMATPAVGSFARSTALSFSPPPLRHGTPTNMTFAFSPEMVVAKGETVRSPLSPKP